MYSIRVFSSCSFTAILLLFQILVLTGSGVLGVYGGGASSLFAALSFHEPSFLQFWSTPAARFVSLIGLVKGSLATTGNSESCLSSLSSL